MITFFSFNSMIQRGRCLGTFAHTTTEDELQPFQHLFLL